MCSFSHWMIKSCPGNGVSQWQNLFQGRAQEQQKATRAESKAGKAVEPRVHRHHRVDEWLRLMVPQTARAARDSAESTSVDLRNKGRPSTLTRFTHTA